jgi:hypothetical protein
MNVRVWVEDVAGVYSQYLRCIAVGSGGPEDWSHAAEGRDMKTREGQVMPPNLALTSLLKSATR